MSIELQQLGIRAGSFARHTLSLTVTAGEYAVLMGRTGCGKTTLIETICGLRPAASGRVLLAGRDVSRLRAADRGIGYVPQDGALFPSMTVREQLEFPLAIRRAPRRECAARVDELAARLGLRELLDRYPSGLSGGERQRTAIGRALSFAPEVLLLDEPLSALDDETRAEVQGVLSAVREQPDVTVLHVTHNRADAAALADVVHVLTESGFHAETP